jgi:hypothetical protein
MKKFLVLYRAPISAQEQMSKAPPDMAKKGMEMWMEWGKRAASQIVDMGAPTMTCATLGGSPAAGFVGGFSILQGENVDHVKKALDGHPHLMMPGATIEVLEFLPMPGM